MPIYGDTAGPVISLRPPNCRHNRKKHISSLHFHKLCLFYLLYENCAFRENKLVIRTYFFYTMTAKKYPGFTSQMCRRADLSQRSFKSFNRSSFLSPPWFQEQRSYLRKRYGNDERTDSSLLSYLRKNGWTKLISNLKYWTSKILKIFEKK